MLNDDDNFRVERAFFNGVVKADDEGCSSGLKFFLEILHEYGYEIVKQSDDNAKD